MENKVLQPIRYLVCGALIFVTAASLMLGALLLSALVPKEAIKEKTLESAEYLYEGELFGEALSGIEGSRIDRYADAILLNIAWHYGDGSEDLNTEGGLNVLSTIRGIPFSCATFEMASMSATSELGFPSTSV